MRIFLSVFLLLSIAQPGLSMNVKFFKKTTRFLLKQQIKKFNLENYMKGKKPRQPLLKLTHLNSNELERREIIKSVYDFVSKGINFEVTQNYIRKNIEHFIGTMNPNEERFLIGLRLLEAFRNDDSEKAAKVLEDIESVALRFRALEDVKKYFIKKNDLDSLRRANNFYEKMRDELRKKILNLDIITLNKIMGSSDERVYLIEIVTNDNLQENDEIIDKLTPMILNFD